MGKTYKIIEVVGTSSESYDKAIKNAPGCTIERRQCSLWCGPFDLGTSVGKVLSAFCRPGT